MTKDSLSSNANLGYKQLSMNMKFMFKNQINYIFAFFFVLMSLCISMVFIPIMFTFAIIMQIGTILPVGIIYASISYELNNSTLNSNFSLTKSSKKIFYSAMITTMLIFMLIFTIIFLVFFFIFNSLSLVLTGWFSYGGRDAFSLIGTGFNWDILIYTQIINVIIMFSLCFFVEDILTTKKSFYTLILIFIVLCFIFGGSLNDYFDFINVNTVFDDANGQVVLTIVGHDQVIVPVYDAALFPTFLFIPSLFFPFYSTGQLISVAAGEQYMNDILGCGNEISINIWTVSKEAFDSTLYGSIFKNEGKGIVQLVKASGGAWRWNILWVLPYIYSLSFFLLGVSHRKYKN